MSLRFVRKHLRCHESLSSEDKASNLWLNTAYHLLIRRGEVLDLTSHYFYATSSTDRSVAVLDGNGQQCSSSPHLDLCALIFDNLGVLTPPHLFCSCRKRSFITYEKPIFTTRVAANLRHWRPHAQRSWSTFGWISIFDMTTWLLPCHVTVKQTEYIFPLPPLLHKLSFRLHIKKSQLILSNQPT